MYIINSLRLANEPDTFYGGEKGGVGKSVVARLLAQYLIDKEKHFNIYDADLSHGAMMRYYADFAVAVDLNRFDNADSIAEKTVKTVDYHCRPGCTGFTPPTKMD